MDTTFVGREEQLRLLEGDYDKVRMGRGGGFILVRGRRRVGKTRLVDEFLRRQNPPNIFFAASRGRAPDRELANFTDQLAGSDLPAAELVRAGARFESWDAALGLIAETSERQRPSVVVIDELPYLLEGDPSVEGALQTVWDRSLQHSSVLLIVIGSDLAMMSALTEYGRPLFDRPTRAIHLPPLTPAEVGDMLGLDATRALDTYLAIGGFPLLALSWGAAKDIRRYLRRALADPTAPLIVSGERTLAAEFPPDAQARLVLSAIGSGETTFTSIGRASGVPRQSLERALTMLAEKKVIDRALPLSSRASREARYAIVDPHLRFWLRFIEPALNEIERGRSGLVVERIMERWPDYRGKAIEPLVREAVTRMLPSEAFDDAVHVGAYWTRKGDLEIDLVGTSKPTRPSRVSFVGSIKWRTRSPFGSRDLAELAAARANVPGADERTLLVGVSRTGFSTRDLAVALGPDEILEAWRAV